MKPSKPYEEVQITPTLIWRWVREGDEYVMRISEMALEAHKAHIEAALAQPEFDTPESHIVKWSIPVDPNNFGEALAQPEQALDKKATNARELGLDYEVDHGFDRTASHMAGEYVDTAGTEHQFKYMFYGLRADENGMFSIGEISQREWVSLTSEELASIVVEHAGFPTRQLTAIEAKLREKNE